MSFEFIEQLPALRQVTKAKFGKDFLITALTDSTVLVFDIKAASLLFEITVAESIQDYILLSHALCYTTSTSTVVMDISTKKELVRTISGRIFELGERLLIISTKTFLLYSGGSIQEVKMFPHGIEAAIISYDKRHLAVSSSDVFVLQTQSMDWQELGMATKVLGIGEKYLVGKEDRIIIYTYSGDMRNKVMEFEEEEPLLCHVVAQLVYYLLPNTLKVINVSLQQTLFTLPTPHSPSDILIHPHTIYLLCSMDLYGHKMQLHSLQPDLQLRQKEQELQRESSLIGDNIEESFVENNDFQATGILNNMLADHNTFLLNLVKRNKAVSAIYKWFSTGNIKAALVALEKQDDTCVLHDSFLFMKHSLLTVPSHELPLLVKLSNKLLSSKYSSHVNLGIQFLNGVLRLGEKCPASALKEFRKSLVEVKKSQRISNILSMRVPEERRELYEQVYSLCFNIDKMLGLG